MDKVIEVFTFKDCKRMYKDEIAYANGEYVLLSDYKKVIDELEHAKHYIKQFKYDTKEMADKIAELESELEVKENLLKIKNGLCGNNDELSTDPMEVTQMLINSTFEREASNLEKVLYKCGDIMTTERYSIDDLEQIAEHLLVYCKHNREDEE